MRIRWIVCFLMLASLSCIAVHAAGPRAEDGVLDLRAAPMAESGPVELSGEWQFHDGVFLDPDDPDKGEPLVLQVPAAWNDQRPGKAGGDGYGTYRLTILLSERDAGKTLGLDLPPIASAYALYINGAEVASAGRIGTSAGAMVPAARPQTVYFTPAGARADLFLHVSNFTQRKGGIWKEPVLGTAEDIGRENRNRMLFQTFIAAGLLLMGVFHVGYHVIRSIRGDRSALWFGLACLLLFLRTMLTGDFLATQLVPSIPWEAAVKAEYLSVFWGISCLVLYFHHLYRDNLHHRVSIGIAGAMIVITLPVLMLPARVYTEWLLMYSLAVIVQILYILYGLVRAAWHRRTGAGFNLAVGLVFLATALNDFFYYNANAALQPSDLVAIGLFLFIFTQMFMLARKSAVAYRETRRLKNELEASNANLERLVALRTEALSRSNAALMRSEQARSELLNDITHELRNPLTSIIGYLRRVIDGAAGHLQTRHIEIAYQKALLLDRIVDDLRKLALLKRDDMSYAFRPVKLREFFEALHQSHDWELLDRKIELRWNIPDDEEAVAHVDLPRMEQVFANLVGNALTHTSPEDCILIAGRYFKNLGVCAIKVRDTGLGIEKSEQHRIFERFYRGGGQIAAGGPGGTGLGLAIAKSITEAHRGRIGMYSEPGRGSAFYFILPVGKEA